MTNETPNKTPLVSVIIPFYNNVSWLCEAVDSVLSQKYTEREIIVVNDGSSEKIDVFLKKYGDRIRYFEKENGGPASARNYGIKHSNGEYIAFLDSDDLWTPDKLSVQIDEMLKSGSKWSYTDYETFGVNVQVSYKRMLNAPKGIYTRTSPYIGTPTVIIESRFLSENNLLFDECLRYGEDSFLWEKAIHISPVLYIPVSLSKVRMRGKNAGRSAIVQLNARVEIYDKCVEKIPGYKSEKTALYKLAVSLCRFGRIFAKKEFKNNRFFELIAKVLFLTPYILFKIDSKRTVYSRC